MIYNVYILTKDGLGVFYRKYGGLEYDEELVTGFLSAISSFGKDISGEEFDMIALGDKQFVSISSENLIFAAYSNKGDKVKNVLSKIKEEFIKNYGEMKSWRGETSVVNGFAPILDEIVGNSGETGNLIFTEIGKLFEFLKKKPGSMQTMERDFGDSKNFVDSLKSGLKSFREAAEKITDFYHKKKKENA